MDIDAGLCNLLESIHNHDEGIFSYGKLCEQVFARSIRLGRVFELRGGFRGRDARAKDDGTGGIAHDATDLARVHLAKGG